MAEPITSQWIPSMVALCVNCGHCISAHIGHDCPESNVMPHRARLASEADRKATRALALEEAAKACDDVEEKRWYGFENPNTFQDAQHKCAEAIRALIGKE